ncbi:RAMP superfamily CRISPR-associated protein [Dapis sp. BLCC M172]|uniref:RAMP superfamily CRISPR-associated protein n=1 Tax=Dapis sp. BLCC M172 TaxID=2975281 RepID=UPI003CF27C20
MISLQQLTNSVETYSITAIIDTALCVGAGGSSGSLADKPIVRNAEGNLLIPASQIKGRLRHECEKIARGLNWAVCESPNPETMCPQRVGLTENFWIDEYKFSDKINGKDIYHCLICQIFGNPSLPSRIIFNDLICEENPEYLPEILRPGVTINRRRGVAEENKLYFLETSPVNAHLKFTGEILIQPNINPKYVDYAKALIWAGFKQINALGGSKSVGLGWLTWELPEISVDEKVWELLAKAEVVNGSDES